MSILGLRRPGEFLQLIGARLHFGPSDLHRSCGPRHVNWEDGSHLPTSSSTRSTLEGHRTASSLSSSSPSYFKWQPHGPLAGILNSEARTPMPVRRTYVKRHTTTYAISRNTDTPNDEPHINTSKHQEQTSSTSYSTPDKTRVCNPIVNLWSPKTRFGTLRNS